MGNSLSHLDDLLLRSMGYMKHFIYHFRSMGICYSSKHPFFNLWVLATVNRAFYASYVSTV